MPPGQPKLWQQKGVTGFKIKALSLLTGGSWKDKHTKGSAMPFSALSAKKVKFLVRGRELFFVAPTTCVAEASALMREKNIGALAVMAGEELVGVLSERDVVQRCVGLGIDPLTCPVSQIMSAPAITIDRNMTMGVAIVMMMERNIRHLPVVNGTRVMGMISIRQLVSEFRKGMEGNILKIAA
jgi:CBS domain-containing protein